MAYVSPARLFAVTRGRSVLCLAVASSGQQAAALSGADDRSPAQEVDLTAQLTPDTLLSLTRQLQAAGILVGGEGAFRADGRPQFGCRALLGKIVKPFASHETAFPVAFWAGDGATPAEMLKAFVNEHMAQ